ncbi:MAG: HU family DNA-binding protein [Deltaproteobacteria bacterium]|jgi:DNA-binding protein HU-beta|nr:HU family DNA-binding protein [Deltaproteobacteria bacterium]MBT4266158.1 HU family DNA-binding protein [Deltaproteobacteria bacterium]MBT4637375.1 HU family DNA-binding protein [Deltaproteobacteria bacterium]MBT6501410.1 HU family DNA-binding protein [Deltaproteobacteria bacterium]MBT7716092.1 HU family DNA-binding protein [Deltaproteobacteria bacterium]
MNKKDLVGKIAQEAEVTKVVATKYVDSALSAMQDAMANGEAVQLMGFGTFQPVEKAARTGRNPQTGKTLEIPAKTVPKFKPGKTLKEAVAGQKKGIFGIFKRKK